MALKREAAVGLGFMVSLMALCGSSYGAVYKVGDSAGWTDQGGVDYKKWASSKTFYVGDIIVFEYDRGHHNVIEASPVRLLSCDISKPRKTYFTGEDYITLYKPGVFSFTCGLPGHCKAGQILTVLVLPPPSMGPISRPTPTPSWAPSPDQFIGSPSTGQISSPTPTQSWAPYQSSDSTSMGPSPAQ
ncbi:mavicyanin-like [Tripterygium wilfordii]|uniref:mavicyanin-like n=1 Tax=Tripterygium wilfordii TaxID=458696 RepID=UPI0018F7F517|nr:mavicyanin-like [Tripterygium wilfordii]